MSKPIAYKAAVNLKKITNQLGSDFYYDRKGKLHDNRTTKLNKPSLYGDFYSAPDWETIQSFLKDNHEIDVWVYPHQIKPYLTGWYKYIVAHETVVEYQALCHSEDEGKELALQHAHLVINQIK